MPARVVPARDSQKSSLPACSGGALSRAAIRLRNSAMSAVVEAFGKQRARLGRVRRASLRVQVHHRQVKTVQVEGGLIARALGHFLFETGSGAREIALHPAP